MSSLFPPTAAQDLQSRVPAAAHLQAWRCQGAAAKQHVPCLAKAVTDTALLPTAERGSICHQALFPGSFYRQVILAQIRTAPRFPLPGTRATLHKAPAPAGLHLHPEHVRQPRGGKAQQGETQHFSEPGREQVCSAGTTTSSVTPQELTSHGPYSQQCCQRIPSEGFP